MKTNTSYRLISLVDDQVHPFTETNDICAFIDDEKFKPSDYYVLETVVTHEKKDMAHELAIYRHNKKEKKAEEKANKKPDIEVEPTIVQGEVKDDPTKKVQGKRPRLSH